MLDNRETLEDETCQPICCVVRDCQPEPERRLQGLLRVAGCPLLLAVVLVGSGALLLADLPESITMFIPPTLVAVSLVVLERVLPWERA